MVTGSIMILNEIVFLATFKFSETIQASKAKESEMVGVKEEGLLDKRGQND